MFVSVNHNMEFNKNWLEGGKLNNDNGQRGWSETNHEREVQLSWKVNK